MRSIGDRDQQPTAPYLADYALNPNSRSNSAPMYPVNMAGELDLQQHQQQQQQVYHQHQPHLQNPPHSSQPQPQWFDPSQIHHQQVSPTSFAPPLPVQQPSHAPYGTTPGYAYSYPSTSSIPSQSTSSSSVQQFSYLPYQPAPSSSTSMSGSGASDNLFLQQGTIAYAQDGEIGDVDDSDGDFELGMEGMGGDLKHSASQGSLEAISAMDGSPKKKQRVTLPRGRACVACRSRKLKCSGERPCVTCRKTNQECRYEEPSRRKPRNVLLEERVVELEALLQSRGESLPPTRLKSGPNLKNNIPRLSPTKDSTGNISFPSPTVKTSRKSSLGNVSISTSGRPQSTTGGTTGLATSLSTYTSGVTIPAQTGTPLAFSSCGPALTLNPNAADIPPHSPLESGLIRLVLPYTPYLSMPIHPHRFLALLSLPANDPSRPHPALLLILFAEAVRILENGLPPPPPIRIPASFYSATSITPPPIPSEADQKWLLSQVRGMSLIFLERSRGELDHGIQTLDRPLDLVRAAIGIARYLYSIGRFVEGWNVPVARLIVSCGLHRLSSNIIPPETTPTPSAIVQPSSGNSNGNGQNQGVNMAYLPLSYNTTAYYHQQYTLCTLPSAIKPLRMRPTIVPPPRDEIDLAERVMTFWSAKMQDWAAGIGWGWTNGLSDEECTTEWPWGWAGAEARPFDQSTRRYTIRDLFDGTSGLHMNAYSESSYVLSVKSLCLLNRASHLNDLPESSIPYLQPDGREVATHTPALHHIQAVETALNLFNQRIPPEYTYPPTPTPALNQAIPTLLNQARPSSSHRSDSIGTSGLYSTSIASSSGLGVGHGQNSNSPVQSSTYEPLSDPWYISLHANMFAAEMLTYRELANHDGSAYHRSIAGARGLVGLVRSLQPEQWGHLEITVTLCISLASRLLFREAERLASLGQTHATNMAAEEAESLRSTLNGELSRWMPMASLHALIISRMRDGLTEKEGEYERV